ncbi:sarcoplasmic reticulum histidine-rich calcium-binding protein-like [Phlebotomus argentipes]|uniref:sarcoplasmic reticulum histidine-rich calcium-binding protein-like n=1 Tax=Phlebotomus argentipes TaxID=94469 RepID=UPI002892CFF2|nr:sarcoplasmic reticulum histidine-rich calcium-binding protein-like [Phlebotomus argentipes]
MERISCTILLLVTLACASGETNYNKKMYMKRSSMDQDTSATGYIYSKYGSNPAQFVYLDSDAVAAHFKSSAPSHLPLIQDGDQYGTHSYVVTHSGGYPSQFVPSSAATVANLYYNSQPSAAYTLEADAGPPLASYVSTGGDYHYDGGDVDGGDFDATGGHFSERYSDGDDHHHYNHDHSEGDGSEYGEEYHKKHGHEGKKAYDTENKFEKGSKGHYDKEDHSGHYDEDGGHKKSYYDEGDEYGQHHEGAHSSKGGKFGEKKHHKKGSKTTGYHNVFHKDEFKKDHTFYDDADHKGNFKKYGSDHQHHHKGASKYGKGGHYDSANHEGHKGKKGHFDKGYHDIDDQGYDKKHDHEAHHHDGEEYYKKHGKDGDEHHGFDEKHYH